MGHFYTNATLKGATHDDIVKAIQRMGRIAGVSPTVRGLTVVFDQKSERQNGSAYPFLKSLTKKLGCIALYVTNHDDSVLYYRLYDSGEVIDNYDSSPNYFDGPPAPPSGGNAEQLCKVFGKPSARKKVQAILEFDSLSEANQDSNRYVFEVDRHRDLARALGLPLITVGFGYTYLAEGNWPKGLTPENIVSLTGKKTSRKKTKRKR